MSSTPAPHAPIHLRVNYKSPEALLHAFTRSVGLGGVELPSQREAPIGMRFVFELAAKDVLEPVRVLGEVVNVSPAGAGGGFSLTIRYDAGLDRKGLDAVLRQLFDEHRNEKIRSHPRVPVHLTSEHASGAVGYLVKDLSRGGARVQVLARELPHHIQGGAPVLMRVSTTEGDVALHGQIAWAQTPSATEKGLASFGIRFGTLQASTGLRLDRLLVLYGLPTGPWRAQMSFGMEAIEQMP